MTTKASTAKQVLIEEALGDIQICLEKLDIANRNAQATAEALNLASKAYQERIDGLVDKLRTETSQMILKTTQHAAEALVTQQHAALQAAASKAMTQVLKKELQAKEMRHWLQGVALGAAAGAVASTVIVIIYDLFLK